MIDYKNIGLDLKILKSRVGFKVPGKLNHIIQILTNYLHANSPKTSNQIEFEEELNDLGGRLYDIFSVLTAVVLFEI